ncbi:DUF1304 domain-containing protein [Enterococcus mundtii]|uniref:DUF1304 domain-containing protein n=1 Tax=Enterococcus mundtii TaxID=53346 RepID=A0A2S7RYE4_ENTMU|nr:DUF1304 domain-containing protein [Enterococcus mundtii]PQF25113.1 DUF1304 domain-containing protein [Enterococcus mundtii]
MTLLSQILVTLVALEFLYIMYIETFATESATTSRVFNMPKEELRRQSVQTLFKNQGIYNGLLGVALLYGAYFSNAPKEITGLLLIYILLVAAYGSLTSDRLIIVKQGGLAAIALITLFF